MMKFDMHCHTKEGSVDAKVPVGEYISLLKQQGFDGMLVTDHDSYDGYRSWRKNVKGDRGSDFIVLRGVEYDTVDGGHFLVILPSGISLKILEIRGLPVQLLISLVHHYGGILGPAHPCGERYLSLFSTGKYAAGRRAVNRADQSGTRKKTGAFRIARTIKTRLAVQMYLTIAEQIDFLEGYNACESDESNKNAMKIAKEFKIPVLGGSDSHKFDCVGTGFTVFEKPIRNENDLIRYIKSGRQTVVGGNGYTGTTKNKIGGLNNILVQSFWFYNKIGALLASGKRRSAFAYARNKCRRDHVNVHPKA